MTFLGMDNRTLLLAAGSLHVLLPACVWLVLGMPRQRAPLHWCAGGMMAGTGLVLMGLRGSVPDALSYLVGQPLMLLGSLALAQSLRLDLGRAWRWRWLVLVTALYTALVAVMLQQASLPTLGMGLRAANLVAVVLILEAAWKLAHAENSRNASLITAGVGLQAAAILTNLVHAARGSSDIQTLQSSHWSVTASLLMLLVSLMVSMGYLGMGLERSRRRQLHLAREVAGAEQWRERRDALVRRDRERLLGLLADSLCHEVLQPLTAALLRLQLAQRQLNAGADRQALLPAVDDVIRNLRQAIETVQRIRCFVRPLSNNCAPVELGALIRDLSLLLSKTVQDKQLDLRLTLPDAPVWVMGDALQLSQALLQLVRNATTALQGRRPQVVQIGLACRENQIQLTVSDTGPGLPAAVLQRHDRSSGAWPRSLEGIGLFVVRSIVLRHEGTLLLGNVPTGGAEVAVVLPRHFPVPAGQTPAS
jgi:signal transduction histidine kinase